VREISLHLLDLIENSLEAGAKQVRVRIVEDPENDWFWLEVEDDGKGMDESLRARATDPFVTGRKTRRVGLGLALLEAACRRCGGELAIWSEAGRGTRIRASFRYHHLDRAPLGDVAGTLMTVLTSRPDLLLTYSHQVGKKSFSFDSAQLQGLVGAGGQINFEVFAWWRDYLTGKIPMRRAEMENYRCHVLVCAGAGCVSSGCQAVATALLDELEKLHLTGEVRVVETGCMGPCDLGPVLIVYPEGVFYQKLTPEGARLIAREHLLKGRIVDSLTYRKPGTAEPLPNHQDIDFFKRQTRIALRNTGLIDPLRVEEYIARDGYFALARVLTSMKPEDVIETIKRSGLRGRGGGGFPTGQKWELAARAADYPKYVVCNADEGDPGAFMDRSILEGDPHSVLEGMAIAAYAIGAKRGYIYIRAEYPLAVERVSHAIRQAREYGLLGKNLFGTGFDFDVEIRVGAGAFVCGEETALLASIEGRRGEPRPRPPFPAQAGLWGKPTVINNVETLANIPPIILNGAEWFSAIGTEKSKGTKVFALAGKVVNTGLVEVPMGTTLAEIIYELGGGIPNGKKFKAAQTGGPSGGCIPAQYLDTPVDYESLTQLGTIMGSGGLIIMDESTCMVDLARFFLEFVQHESCGKCTPCRIGTKRMLEIVQRITRGEGREGDLELLEELALQIKNSALCGLGQTAPNPVLSTLRYFREEYEAHIREKKCPAGVCQALIKYQVLPEKCTACGKCQRACPVGAISGKGREIRFIESDRCVKCGECSAACPFGAIVKA